MKPQRKPERFAFDDGTVLEPVATRESKTDALEEARAIVRELSPRHVRAFDDVA